MHARRHAAIRFTALALAFLLFLSAVGRASAEDSPTVTTRITPDENIIVDGNGDFTVPLKTRVVWTVEVFVSNPASNTDTLKSVRWSNNYDAALEFDNVSADRGYLDYTSPSPPTQMRWDIGTLSPGDSAYLTFQLATRVNNGGQQMYGDTGCGDWESGAVFKYKVEGRPGQRSVEYGARRRCVEEEPPWVSFEFTGRKDWRIRRPGCYASQASAFRIASNGAVSVSFDDFDDLAYLDDPTAPAIPTSYSWGDSIDEADGRGWRSGTLFNGTTWNFAESSALEQGVSRTLWSKICVGAPHSSSDYEDEGTVTITLQNGSAFVAP